MFPEFDDVKIKTEEELFDEIIAQPAFFKALRNAHLFDNESWSTTFDYRGINMKMRLIIPSMYDKQSMTVKYNPSHDMFFQIETMNIPDGILEIYHETVGYDEYLTSETTEGSFRIKTPKEAFEIITEKMRRRIDLLFDSLIPSIEKEIEERKTNIEHVKKFYGGLNNV